MNKLIFVTSVLVFNLSLAGACPRNATQVVCPGDTIVDSTGTKGYAAAVNPFQKTVALNYGGSTDEQCPLESVFVGVGCLSGYCVGDNVVDTNGTRGVLGGVNPYNNEVALDYGGTKDEILPITSVSLGFGCLNGYCVGDGLVDANGTEGRLEAIDYSNRILAMNYGGTTDEMAKIETFSNSASCSGYGEVDRSVPRFPIFDEKLYVSETFQYSLYRPFHN